jgi:hypothetical protein
VGEMKNAHNTLARKPEEKRPHGRHIIIGGYY